MLHQVNSIGRGGSCCSSAAARPVVCANTRCMVAVLYASTLPTFETEISQRAVTWVLWCSCPVVITVNGRSLLVHFVGLLTLLCLGASGPCRIVSAPRTVQTAIWGQQTVHLHRDLSRRGFRTGVDRRRRDGWQGVSQNCVFIGDVRRAATLVPHLIWQ